MSSRKGFINPESNTGIIFYKILSDLESKSCGDVQNDLANMGIEMKTNNVSANLLSLFNRKVIRRKKVDGGFMYIKPAPIHSDIGVNRIKEDMKAKKKTGKGYSNGPRAPHGQKTTAIIKAFQENIGVPLTPQSIAQIANTSMNSSVGKSISKIVAAGVVEKNTAPGSTRALSYTALPSIAEYVDIKGKTGQKTAPTQQSFPMGTPAHIQQPVPAVVPEVGNAQLVTMFQGVLEQQTQNEQYKQALFQIAGILESIGIIEGA